MSLTGALLAGVSGLQAQSNAMGIVSDNIANLNTIGYKTATPTFQTLVVDSLSASYAPGGVQSGAFSNIGAQGTLQASNSPLDVAITGNGFFPVTDAAGGSGNALYTRAGSFHQDTQGRLVNSAGLFLEGWPLTQSGQIANVNQLQVVSVGTTNGVAVGTQNVTIGANLDSSQPLFGGNSATTNIGSAFTSLSSTSNLGRTITSTIGNASTTNATDLGAATASGGLGLDTTSTVTITVPGVGTQTFSYVAGGGNGTTTFTSLSDLETDINAFAGAGTVSDNGASPPVLTINATSAGINIAAGGTNSSALFGSTGIAALGLANGDSFTVSVNGTPTTLTYTTSTSPGANQFHTLADLASALNGISGLQATISGSAPPSLTVNSADAVTMTNGTGTPVTALFGGSVTFGVSYTAGDMQDGTVTPQFTNPIQVFDALGTAHTVNLAVLRTGTNQWSYELYDSDSDVAGTAAGRGLLSAGTITFNGDGSLNSVTATPATLPSGATNQPIYSGTPPAPAAVSINWANGASTSAIKFNLGTAGAVGTGKTDGLTQFASAFNKNFTNQDGAAVGLQTGVSIDKNGYVIATYSNGATQKLFQVPITTFADPSALQAQDGNSYSQTVASGNANWRAAGTGGAGTIATSSLEESNADLGSQFALMITTQTAYSANSKTITTANQMLQQLLQIIQG